MTALMILRDKRYASLRLLHSTKDMFHLFY